MPGSASFNSADTIDTFTPTSALAAGTTYTVTVSGAQNSSGQTMTTDTYTFTTSKAFDAGGQCPCAIWPDTAPSGATDANETSSVNLGVQFQASANGTVSGIRFYKEPDNTGSHTGTLWTASGTELATGTFTNESTQGWEELDFSTPVTVTAGTTYVASYLTTTGHYADTSGGLSSAVTNGPLTALANGGVYAYGSSTTFPTSTYGGSNYWVDVVYQQDASAPAVTATTPRELGDERAGQHRPHGHLRQGDQRRFGHLLAHRPGRNGSHRHHLTEQRRDGAHFHSLKRAQRRHRLSGQR